ncbi:MAG: hypothetical protein RLZZ158_14 [Cyanobacteriota bacterium]|jgi:hypothetical protein
MGWLVLVVVFLLTLVEWLVRPLLQAGQALFSLHNLIWLPPLLLVWALTAKRP